MAIESASVAQSVVHLTRNEKVACSSQVTSSMKTPGFVKIPGVFSFLKKSKNDIIYSFAYEFERLRLLVKSFAFAHGEIKDLRLW